MRIFVRTFDALVRGLQGVFDFSADPACILRLRRTRLRRPIRLVEGRFPVGTSVLELHLSNERIPALPLTGPDLRWAALAARRLRLSLRQVADFVLGDAGDAPAALIGGTTILIDGAASERLLRRLGFEIRRNPPERPLEALRNRYALTLMAVFNPPSRRRRSATTVRRTEVWMSMGDFLRRYEPAAGSTTAGRGRDALGEYNPPRIGGPYA